MPAPSGLLEAVERLLESAHEMLLAGLRVTRQLAHVDRFVELPVEVGALDVHLVHRPPVIGSDHENDADGRQLSDGGKCFMEIYPGLL